MNMKSTISDQRLHSSIMHASLALAGAALWIVLAASADGADQPSLLANGDLETADAQRTDLPAGFKPGRIGKHDAEMTWASPGYKSNRCIAVRTTDSSGLGYWQAMAAVKPTTTYTISLYYRTAYAEPAATAGAGNLLYNQGRPGGPNLELGMLPDDLSDSGKPAPWSDIGIALHPVGGLFLPLATEWSPFRYTFTTRTGQTKLIVKLRLCHYAQKVWFDKVSLVEGATPSPELLADPLWVQYDTTPPAVFRPSPSPNSSVAGDTEISVMFGEKGTGIDVNTAEILFDGVDVTARAIVTADGLTLPAAEPLTPGRHSVKVTVADAAGNRGNTLAWQFGVGKTLNNRLVAKLDSTRLNGEPFFPIGIYAYACHPDDGRFREDHLEQAADAGFNIVFNTIEKRQGLDKELAHGIMGTLNITGGLNNCTSPAAAQAALFEKGQGRLADHPCVIAFWADDPENIEDTKATPISDTTIAKMQNARTALKDRFPYIPSVFAISNLPRLRPAMPYGDILLSYRYAVPHYHPMKINGYTIAACRTMVPDKPLWFLSQAFDLGYGSRFKLAEPMRPTPEEVRAMAFYGLVCGINGYALYANYLNAKDYPEHWTAALDIAKHIRHIAEPLTVGEDVRTVHLKEGPGAGSIFCRELKLDGRHTLIAVNMSAGAVPVTWRFGQPVRMAVMFENRTMKKAADTVSDVFDPWGVRIYQW